MPPATESTTAPSDAIAWDDALLRDPHAVSDKRRRVQQMFAAIAPSYDLNNRLHSLWMDQRWRRKAVKLAELKPLDVVVDVACGTGDLAIAFFRVLREQMDLKMPWEDIDPQVIGVDFTFEMLPIARSKSAIGNRQSAIAYLNGDAQSLPLPDACCDVVSIAFGIRNVQDPARALREFRRVLRPGGRLIILEFSLPTNRILRGLYNFYFRKILPRTATLVSGDKTGAYRYLPESVNTFIGREQMTRMMQEAGFSDVTQHPMTFGVCVGYRGLVPVQSSGDQGIAPSEAGETGKPRVGGV
jgi:demethylmenaquinone methyltransferase / 2-methoxy-6-polyprenyl-1,4-benzoquinol methylase